MRYIQKGNEPAAFTEWKTQGDGNWDPGWLDFDGRPIKQVVAQALLDEQGYLCCYCEMRVGVDVGTETKHGESKSKGHIEHIDPRHKRPDLALTYENLVYSCGETDRGEPTTCGHARKPDDPVPVSPLQPDCESRFLYTANGRMVPRGEYDEAARETVRILKLNEKLLRDSRAEVYQEVEEASEELSPGEFERWMDVELGRDSSNMLKPFWGTKRYLRETMRTV